MPMIGIELRSFNVNGASNQPPGDATCSWTQHVHCHLLFRGSSSMDWLPDELLSLASRIVRADQLAYEVGDVATEWSRSAPITFVQERKGDKYQVVPTGMRPIPPEIPLKFAEAINHARSAVENAVWHLVISNESGEISEKAQRHICMPVHLTEKGFADWCKKGLKLGLTTLGEGHMVRKRIESLQPFADTHSTIDSCPIHLTQHAATTNEQAQALHLLHRYWNDDKHRAATVVAGLTRQEKVPVRWDGQTFTELDRPVVGAAFEALRLGFPVERGTYGVPSLTESASSVQLRRPSPYTAHVAPASELASLVDYVANTALPTLIVGMTIVGAFPRDVPLGEGPEDLRTRLRSGSSENSFERFQPVVFQKLLAAWDSPPSFPETVWVDEFTGGDLPD